MPASAAASTQLTEGITIRRLEPTDLPAVAAVHVAAFPSSALTTLGEEAVRRYYQWQLLGPHDVTPLGAFVGGELAGFCFGGTFRGAMAGFLRENQAYLASRVLVRPWLLVNPVFRDRFGTAWRSLRRKRGSASRTSAPKPDASAYFGILSIAVHPARQGTGLGQRLMHEAEAAARHRGFRAMDLTVDPANLQGVQFYKRLQWEPIDAGARWNGRMTKTLDA